jgi:hypothetical protein
MVVTEVVEGRRFQLAFARLVRLGPLMDAALRAHVERMKAELVEHGARPPGAVPHPDRDGSMILELAGLRLRYYVTKPKREAWVARVLRGLRSHSSGVRVRVRQQGLDWPGVERLAGS